MVGRDEGQVPDSVRGDGPSDEFSKLVGQLKRLAAEAEKDGTSLEETVSLLEEGVDLAEACAKLAEKAELEIMGDRVDPGLTEENAASQ